MDDGEGGRVGLGDGMVGWGEDSGDKRFRERKGRLSMKHACAVIENFEIIVSTYLARY